MHDPEGTCEPEQSMVPGDRCDIINTPHKSSFRISETFRFKLDQSRQPSLALDGWIICIEAVVTADNSKAESWVF